MCINALGRMATSSEHVQALAASGSVEALLTLLTAQGDNKEVWFCCPEQVVSISCFKFCIRACRTGLTDHLTCAVVVAFFHPNFLCQ